MKKTFFQYNMKRDGKINNIIENGIIILDTNAILNIYRVNKENRKKYFEVLNSIKDRLFLTFQSAQEFYNNRLTIIYNKCKFKEDLKKELKSRIMGISSMVETNDFQQQDKNTCYLIKHEQNLKNNIIQILNKAKLEIEVEINSYNDDIDESFIKDNDDILDIIMELFEGKVNKKLSKEKLEEIYKLGEERYKNDVPLGYKDKNKPESERYGDLVIWNEIIEISIKQNKDVLFISDDKKENWYKKFKEYDLGTRPDLVKEFFDKTNRYFQAITTKSFINYIAHLHNIEGTKDLEEESDIIRGDVINEDFKLEADLNLNGQLDEIKRQIDNMNDSLIEFFSNSNISSKSISIDDDSYKNERKKQDNYTEILK